MIKGNGAISPAAAVNLAILRHASIPDMVVERENVQISATPRMHNFIYRRGTNTRRMIEAVVRIHENGTSLLIAREHGGDDICHHSNAAAVGKEMSSTSFHGSIGARRISLVLRDSSLPTRIANLPHRPWKSSTAPYHPRI